MTAGYALNGDAILTARDTWPIDVPNYRGVCRGLWWPLSEHDERDEIAHILGDILLDEWIGQWPDFPKALVDSRLLREDAEAAEALSIPIYGLLCASPSKRDNVPTWLNTMPTQCEHLGIDICYASGSYSFLMRNFTGAGSGLPDFFSG